MELVDVITRTVVHFIGTDKYVALDHRGHVYRASIEGANFFKTKEAADNFIRFYDHYPEVLKTLESVTYKISFSKQV